MQGPPNRQSRRIAQRRPGRRQSEVPAPTRYASQSRGTSEQRQAQFALVVLGLVFVGMCVTYVLLSVGEIAG